MMRIQVFDGMVSIDDESMSYSNINNMYKTGSGHGLQLSNEQEHKRGEVLYICGSISEKIYELQDILKR